MKAELFDWVKLLLDKWTIVVPMLLFIGSTTGLSFSMMDNSDKDIELIAKDEQITNIANHYTKPKAVESSDCNYCKKEINKLKRWHE